MAFEVAQRAKSRSFLDMLAEAEVELRCRAAPEYREREREILGRIEELFARQEAAAGGDSIRIRAGIAGLEQELDFLEQDLRRSDPRYTELQYPQPAGLDDLQDGILKPGELFLEYMLGDSAAYLWKLTQDAFSFHKLPRGREIDSMVRRILPYLSDYNILGSEAAYFAAAATDLSQVLLKPVESDLAQCERLLIAPHGILYYLPFEILAGEPPAEPAQIENFAQFPFLVSKLDFVYFPSAGALARMRESPRGPQASAQRELLVIGDPQLPEAGEMSLFARLALSGEAAAPPYAGEEIEMLAGLFGEGALVLRGPEAVAGRLAETGTTPGFRLIHFATHGLFNEHRPRYSGLVLSPAPGSGDDGFLSLGEVFSLDMPCEQVVLSACSSALGEQVSGEGILGLTRAFIYSGARSVVAALWEVAGQATSFFMRDFYSEIAVAGDRAAALAEAKRRMIRRGDGGDGLDYSHPYFWSAFVLTGRAE
jgi:CHAT domain-containing protein